MFIPSDKQYTVGNVKYFQFETVNGFTQRDIPCDIHKFFTDECDEEEYGNAIGWIRGWLHSAGIPLEQLSDDLERLVSTFNETFVFEE